MYGLLVAQGVPENYFPGDIPRNKKILAWTLFFSIKSFCLFVCPFALEAYISSVYSPILLIIILKPLPWRKKSKSMIEFKIRQ